jgi:glycosyltransferase involved in cell wall biosynthesis
MLISICIPSYEKVEKLKNSIFFILNQTYQNFEVIISDDSISENIFLMCNSFKSDKIKYFKHSSTGNPIDNWNYSISKANGDIITLLHDDDFLYSNLTLELVVNTFSNSKIDLLFSNSIHIENNIIIGCNKCEIPENLSNIFIKNTIGAPSILFLKNDFITQYDNNLTWYVDVDFYYRILLEKNMNYFLLNQYLIGIDVSKENRLTTLCLNNNSLIFKELLYLNKKHKLLKIKKTSFTFLLLILKYFFKVRVIKK